MSDKGNPHACDRAFCLDDNFSIKSLGFPWNHLCSTLSDLFHRYFDCEVLERLICNGQRKLAPSCIYCCH